MDTISEQRLALVCPMLATKVRQMSDILAAEGILIRVVQGLRTAAEQDELYAQGRSTPGKIVTNCRGGYSYHNFGLAVDCVPSSHGADQPYDPDWNRSHPVWHRMTACGISVGLDSGSTWRSFPDFPHFQFTGRFPEDEPTDEARIAAHVRGIEGVWAAAFSAPPA